MSLQLKNMTVRYGETTVVDAVTAKAASGELIALVGPNGSGKSSLLKAVCGLIPHAGKTSLPMERKTRAAALSYLAQDVTAPPRRTVSEIVGLGRTPYLGPLAKLSNMDYMAIGEALENCGISDLSQRSYATLSGGQQSRVHLARALATQAPLLLADEPVTALDPFFQLTIMDTLRAYADGGRTVIAALHDLHLARTYADRVWVMSDGRLVADDTPARALTPETLAEVFRIRPAPDGRFTLT